MVAVQPVLQLCLLVAWDSGASATQRAPSNARLVPRAAQEITFTGVTGVDFQCPALLNQTNYVTDPCPVPTQAKIAASGLDANCAISKLAQYWSQVTNCCYIAHQTLAPFRCAVYKVLTPSVDADHTEMCACLGWHGFGPVRGVARHLQHLEHPARMPHAVRASGESPLHRVLHPLGART